MALDATPGGAAANSFASLAEAAAYFEGRLHAAAWATADTPTKETALRWATRELDRMAWAGYRYSEAQRLRWPRASVYNLDGYRLANNVIPPFLSEATAELALWLIGEDRTAPAQGAGLSKIEVGSIKVDFDKRDKPAILPRSVARMIGPYIDAPPARFVGRA